MKNMPDSIFFTREICVCAHLTQTRDALEKCAEMGINMQYSLEHHIMTETEKQIVCSWKYPNEYALYNLPTYDEMKAKKLGFMNPASANNYHSFYDKDIFAGFVNILEEATEVFIGIGTNPDYCNRGYGQQMLQIAYEISKSQHPAKPLYLEVREWNKRAIHCYEKAGFVIDGTPYQLETSIGSGTFYRMTRK